MGVFAHAQTVDTRPLFPPTTWPGYEAKRSEAFKINKNGFNRLFVFFVFFLTQEVSQDLNKTSVVTGNSTIFFWPVMSFKAACQHRKATTESCCSSPYVATLWAQYKLYIWNETMGSYRYWLHLWEILIRTKKRVQNIMNVNKYHSVPQIRPPLCISPSPAYLAQTLAEVFLSHA